MKGFIFCAVELGGNDRNPQKHFIVKQQKKENRHCVKSFGIRSFSGPYFPTFGLNVQSECGKIRTRTTPNADTFHEVRSLLNFHL